MILLHSRRQRRRRRRRRRRYAAAGTAAVTAGGGGGGIAVYRITGSSSPPIAPVHRRSRHTTGRIPSAAARRPRSRTHAQGRALSARELSPPPSRYLTPAPCIESARAPRASHPFARSRVRAKLLAINPSRSRRRRRRRCRRRCRRRRRRRSRHYRCVTFFRFHFLLFSAQRESLCAVVCYLARFPISFGNR